MSEKMVKTLVETCLRVGPKDVVTVNAGQHTIGLATKVALACYRRGADVLTILDTDDMYFGYMKMLSVKQLSEPSKHCLALGGYTTVNIFMGGVEDPSRLQGIPGEKYAAVNKAERPHFDLMLKRKIRVGFLALGNVTKQRAETYGLDLKRWRSAVEKASTEDFAEVNKFGKKVSALLEKGRTVQITAPGGTSLKFKLARRPVHLYDGIVDEADLNKGIYFTGIPSGVVGVSVLESSAEGRFISDIPIPWNGRMVEGLSWKFKAGKVVEFKAERNLKSMKPEYDSATGEKDRLGALYLGLNRKAEIGQMFNLNQLASGAISVQLGDNDDLGGKNYSDFSCLATVSKGTLKIDGKTIIKNGKFVA